MFAIFSIAITIVILNACLDRYIEAFIYNLQNLHCLPFIEVTNIAVKTAIFQQNDEYIHHFIHFIGQKERG